MAPHDHEAQHRPVPITVSPSILRMSFLERLAAAAVAIAAIWAAVLWAMS